MFFLLLSCLSFLLFCQSVILQPLVLWFKRCGKSDMTDFPIWGKVGLSELLLLDFARARSLVRISASMCLKRNCHQRIEPAEDVRGVCLLDLPDLALEVILSRLPPNSLCTMTAVCTELRERCRSNHFWEPHLKKKWGRVVGPAAFKKWQLDVADSKDVGILESCKAKDWLGSLSCVWPFSWLRGRRSVSMSNNKAAIVSPPSHSAMAWYLALESGKFWFPAQVYNREHGHVGFMLSCYDAEICYNNATDTFQARYPPHGNRTIVIEEGIQWERLRAPPVETSAHDLYVSDSLNDLHAEDRIEIQWRRSKEFPYGWWYGVVGHQDSCGRQRLQCRCHLSEYHTLWNHESRASSSLLNPDTVILEFNQYTPGSRWRRAVIKRKEHQEEGNEAEGFYGGVRKLKTEEESSTWRRLWPAEILD